MFFLIFLYCLLQVEAYATGRSLVQKNTTKCLNESKKPVCGGRNPCKDYRVADDDEYDDDDKVIFGQKI